MVLIQGNKLKDALMPDYLKKYFLSWNQNEEEGSEHLTSLHVLSLPLQLVANFITLFGTISAPIGILL
jgi:hypothetical protein